MVNDGKDRNFDDLAAKFEHKVYGGRKGAIRLAVITRDLENSIPQVLLPAAVQPLRVLDVGAGLGQFAIKLASLGHQISYNDLSEVMMAKARQQAATAGVEESITWYAGPFQRLPSTVAQPFDLILCHALLEWLASPKQLIAVLKGMLKPGGYLSLCFYNPSAMVYRNLIRGNFAWVKQSQGYQANQRSLTPNNAVALPQVRAWIAAEQMQVLSESGIRVFSDYVVEKRGGNQFDDEVLAMELEYSRQQPYLGMGRYLHLMAQ